MEIQLKALMWRTDPAVPEEEARQNDGHSRGSRSDGLKPNVDDVVALRRVAKRSAVLDPTRTGGRAGDLENGLKRMITGQDEAIEQIVNMYQMYLSALNPPGRPVGNLLFLGPTGSGKTRIVEATAEVLTRNPRAVIKIDCSEFQHSHEIAKLIGSPPGYLGHRETHPLFSQEVLSQHHTEDCKLSFILFDEIEKASDSLWNLLLGILDKATLTLGDNRRVDFSQTLIFMTSNLGAEEMEKLTSTRLGFSSVSVEPTESHAAKVERTGIAAARRRFTPEFMNRLDKVVVFRPLTEQHLRRILEIELQQVQQRIFSIGEECPFIFSATAAVKQHLLDEGTDPKYGARHLKRAIERLLVQPMSNLIATEQVRFGDWVKVDYQDGIITFQREAEGLPLRTMAEIVSPGTGQAVEAASNRAIAQSGKSQSARSSRRS